MHKKKRILGIIPARGGSKGLTRKNILPLLGKPLIAWTIEQAHLSKYLDKVIVNTDDSEIAKVAKDHGAEVPFLRPQELAQDMSRGIDVVLHNLSWLEENNEVYDLIILLQPTSPLRKSEDIDNAIELLFSKNAQAIISVCEVEHHPYWENILPETGCMGEFLSNEIMNKNRQERPVFYRLNGAIYLAYCDYLRTYKSFYGNETYAYIMPRERSIDIDNVLDLKLAEFMIRSQ